VGRVFRVEQENARNYTKAILEQLNAEFAASGTDVKQVAAKLGIDYNTFRRYVNGERGMPMHVFWATLAALDIAEDVFVRRARERLDSAPAE